MHARRSRNALVALVAALGLLLTPIAAHAGGRQAAATTAPKRTRSEAAKAGWETRAMKAKADANWGARVTKNPALKGDKVAEAKFKAQSLRAQKQAAVRKPAVARTAKKPKPVRTTKPTRGSIPVEEAVGDAEALAAEAPDAEEPGDLDDLDELGDAEPTERRGLVDRVRSYVKARRVFKEMTDADPGMKGEFTRLSRLGGGFRNAIFMGGGGLLAAVSVLSGGTIGALVGIGAAGFGGARQFVNNNRAREQLVRDLEASGELEPHEIQAYEEAGWL